MSAKILKGKPVTEAITSKIRSDVEELKSKSITPKLAIIRMGSRPDDIAYEHSLKKYCAVSGVETEVFELDINAGESELKELIISLGGDRNTHGILPFRPIPPHIDEHVLKVTISHLKDVDCFGEGGFAPIFDRRLTGFLPCTAEAVIEMLHFYDIPIAGTRSVILGRSMLLGRPLSLLLMDLDSTVTTCHSKTHNIASVAREADILVSAIGQGRAIGADYIKPGAVVIDVGINDCGDGKICGDIDFDAVTNVAGAITPVPGGLGSVTTALLVRNVVRACKTLEGL